MFLSLPLHTAVPATFAFLAGICFEQHCLHTFWLAASALLLLVTIKQSGQRSLQNSWRFPWLLIASACIGFGAMRYQKKQFQQVSSLCTQAHYIRATVESIVPGTSQSSMVITLKLFEIENNSHQTIPITSYVQLRSSHVVAMDVSDCVEIGPLTLHPAQGAFALYAMKEGLAATGTITKKTVVRVLNQASYITSFRSKVRDTLSLSIKRKISPESYALFATIFLGQKQKHQQLTQNIFTRWGLSHQLARSGLHLVIFIFILRWFFGYLPLGHRLKQTMLLLSVFCYYMLSWPTISFIRAVTTFILYYLYDTSLVQISALHLLTIATWLILLPCPIQLFFLDFQLSFGLSYVLLLIGITQYQRKLSLDRVLGSCS
jgi:hypothetical protein